MSITKASMLQRQIADLEHENSDLKIQLMEAQALIKSLSQENQSLSKRLISYKGNTIISYDSTFLTNSFSSPVCDNCNQEIPEENLDLHLVQCLRRIIRCQNCNEPFDVSELDKHVKSSIGNISDLANDIYEGNILTLDSRFAHGSRVEIVDEHSNNLLHIAVKSGKREMVQYFLNKGIGINSRNAFGETPLHMACGKFKDFLMVQFLVSKGSDFALVNQLGDTCMEVAKRNGFHEAVIYFQNKLKRPSTGGSKMFSLKSPMGQSKNEL